MTPHTCRTCGGPMLHHKVLYCSSKCSNEYHNRQKREKDAKRRAAEETRLAKEHKDALTRGLVATFTAYTTFTTDGPKLTEQAKGRLSDFLKEYGLSLSTKI